MPNLPERKESPLMGSAGVGGGVGSNLVSSKGAGAYVDDYYKQRSWRGNGVSSRDMGFNMNMGDSEGKSMVFIKRTDNNADWTVMDTERGTSSLLSFNRDDFQDDNNQVKGFTSTGITLGSAGEVNGTNDDFIMHAFRAKEKFFDIVTYSGDGNSPREIAHNLNSTPGMIFIKSYTNANHVWTIYHQANGWEKYLTLGGGGGTNKADVGTSMFAQAPTATHFSVGSNARTNQSGTDYVAYLFAHDAGGFGADGSESVVKCGSYTGNGGNFDLDVGFEPQFFLYKNVTDDGVDWSLSSTMMGFSQVVAENAGGPWSTDSPSLRPNLQDAWFTNRRLLLKPNGPMWNGESRTDCNSNGKEYVYLCIRCAAGVVGNPEPTETTADIGKYFLSLKAGDDNGSLPPGSFTTNDGNVDDWPIEFIIRKNVSNTSNWECFNRKTQTRRWYTNTITSDDTAGNYPNFSTGYGRNLDNTHKGWAWKQGPGFTSMWYTGSGSVQSIQHALGQVPEMIWIKNLKENDWNPVYHAYTNGGVNPHNWSWKLNLENTTTDAFDTAPTKTHFTVGTNQAMNWASQHFAAMLWCSVPGVSKLGFYTGNGNHIDGSGGTPVSVDLGFQPRFLMVKKDSTASGTPGDSGGWWGVFSSSIGFPVGTSNDSLLRFNENAAEVGGTNYIDPTATGFTVNGAEGGVGSDTYRYIYYAHA